MNREAIFSTLFAMIAPMPELVTTSRRLRHWTDITSSEMPAMFLAQGRQSVEAPAARGLPTKWQIEAMIYLYIHTIDQAPGTVLNPIMDRITSILDPDPAGHPQTLNGLVEWARIEGAIETSEGALGDIEVAMIPIRMLAF